MPRSFWSALFLLLPGVVAGPPTAAAEVQIRERTFGYVVTGRSVHAVVSAMKRGGPHADDGRRALGLADYRYRTRLHTEQWNGTCRVKRADVRMTIYYTLPRLSSSAKLSSRERARWNRILAMIRSHEKQHGRYYRQFANELHGALRRIPARKTCAEVHSRVREIRAKLVKRNKARNQRFDRAQYRPFNKRLKRLAPRPI